ncbi:MAG: hypothetical protein ACKVPX_14100, partial [Myxococcaceae bacterium]
MAAAARWNETLLELWAEERRACADFLCALAEFDKNEAWQPLGYSGLFRYLTRGLGMSEGLAYSRLSAVRLSHWCPAVFPALREGNLCLTTLGEVTKVLTLDNWVAVLPRFFGKSKREAAALAAALLPAKASMRDVVVALPRAPTPALHPEGELGKATSIGQVRPSVLHPDEAALRHKVGEALEQEAGTPHPGPALSRSPELSPPPAGVERFAQTVRGGKNPRIHGWSILQPHQSRSAALKPDVQHRLGNTANQLPADFGLAMFD